MKIARAMAVVVLLGAITVLPGCFLKKKKPPVPPPQAQAPTVTPAPAPKPEPPKPTPPPPTGGEPARPKPEPVTQETPAEKPKPKRPRTHVTKKTPPPAAPVQPEPAPEPPKTVVTEGGVTPAPQPQLSASIGHEDAIHQKMTTAQLLEATDYNLKGVSRALNADEQAIVQHIRSFMQQSRDATKEGDLERAYNLAMKAHLLSDELVKGR